MGVYCSGLLAEGGLQEGKRAKPQFPNKYRFCQGSSCPLNSVLTL
jgi:hypothetical protein